MEQQLVSAIELDQSFEKKFELYSIALLPIATIEEGSRNNRKPRHHLRPLLLGGKHVIG